MIKSTPEPNFSGGYFLNCSSLLPFLVLLDFTNFMNFTKFMIVISLAHDALLNEGRKEQSPTPIRANQDQSGPIRCFVLFSRLVES